MVLRRFEQYQAALANDRQISQKRYMLAPEVTVTRKKTRLTGSRVRLDPAHGRRSGRAETRAAGRGLELRRPDVPCGRQLGIIVTTREKARALCADPEIEIQIVSYGYSRVKPIH